MSLNSIMATLEQLCEQGIFSPLDVQFARFLHRLDGGANEVVLLSAVLVSYFNGQGHICLPLSDLANQTFPASISSQDLPQLQCPPLQQWQQELKTTKVVGMTGDYKPLILEQDRLYLYRYWHYERQFAQQIYLRLQPLPLLFPRKSLKDHLSRLFPAASRDVKQRKAALCALTRRFCIISGGPGTGKTSTVVRILALLLAQQPPLRIALAAPTGKAAARLEEAIQAAIPQLNIDSELKNNIPSKASTLHRLLGSKKGSPYFYHNAQNPLLYDVIVVDEASMIDLALMTKLVSALLPNARLILLGDRDQLASVEAGTILGDLCELAEKKHSILKNNLVLLEKSYRFKADHGIGQMAHAIRYGETEKVTQLLRTPQESIQWQSIENKEQLQQKLTPIILKNFTAYLQARDPFLALKLFNQFRVLCAMRHGAFGVLAINRLIETILSLHFGIKPNTRWYHGRPIMVTRNDYHLRLFNGDTGLILQLPNMPEAQAFFFDAESPDGLRQVWPNRLPEHETVYAMTIHKSQGSEFDEVLLLIPDQISNLLTRELLYTGMTRAKKYLYLMGNREVIIEAMSRRIKRNSGLVMQFESLSKNLGN